MVRLFAVAIVILIAGCASRPQPQQLAVTYLSDPPGAVYYDDTGTRRGYTPVTLNYNVPEESRKSGSVQLRGSTVKWISGASASYKYVDIDLNRFGYNQTVTFRRPDDVAGREQDERFAFDLNNQRAQRNLQAIQIQQQQQQQQRQQRQQRQPKPYVPQRTMRSTCGWQGNQWVCDTRPSGIDWSILQNR